MESKHECNCGCSTNFIQTDFVPEGWRCPVCKRILSPWTTMCPCNGQGIKTITSADCWTTTSTTDKTETITLHNNGNIETPHINTYFNEEETK